jgi:hypothetical protein
METPNALRMDKTVFSVAALTDEPDETAYWHAQSPADRLEALELMRQVMYGYDPATERRQRVLTVVKRPTYHNGIPGE